MKLSSGVRLGPYEIVAPIGAGGMGEVYRALDTRLDRTVAVKILPAEFAEDTKFRIRFEREAKTISALNHPHICALFDVGPDYLVMEHCEGKTLAQRIAGGPLPIEQVLQYGMEMADALDKAHRQGIIHRDLKPSNVMLTKSGVKLLDFGLAKQHLMSTPAESTLQRVSEEGQFVGTIQYMAPEVLQGKEADARSDIFALGLVLYEMVTGKPAFSGTSKASLIAAILEHEPQPIGELKPTTPPALDRLIRACVAKDPDERIQTAHDVALELRWISEEAHPAQTERSGGWVPWTIAAACLIAMMVAGVWIWRSARSTFSDRQLQRFSIAVPADAVIGWQPLAISPDGSRLVYENSREDGRRFLSIRSMSDSEAKPIAGTEDGHTPFFSPDGTWLGFIAAGKLKKIPLSGGGVVAICDVPQEVRGATWGIDDTIVYALGRSGLLRVRASGGSPQTLTKLAANEASHRWAQFLPDGEHVLFTFNDNSGDWDRAKIAVVSLKTGQRRTLLDGDYGRYAGGFLLYARSATLFAAPFDLHAMKVSGNPVPIINDIQYVSGNGSAFYAIGPRGPLLYLPRDLSAWQRQLVWVSRAGAVSPISDVRRNYEECYLSPDGKTLLVAAQDLHEDLWSYDFDRQSWTRLTSQGDNDSTIWSPDGKSILFSSNRNGPWNLFTMPFDGSSPPRQLTSRNAWTFAHSRSPDGRFVTIDDQHPDTGEDILIADTKDWRMEPFQVTPFAE